MTDRQLQSLDASNAERAARHAEASGPSPNGIACPKCGAELLDSRPMVTLTSNPPMKNVHCLACGHAGYRVA